MLGGDYERKNTPANGLAVNASAFDNYQNGDIKDGDEEGKSALDEDDESVDTVDD